jgi:hypothetical protein
MRGKYGQIGNILAFACQEAKIFFSPKRLANPRHGDFPLMHGLFFKQVPQFPAQNHQVPSISFCY